MPGTKAPYLSLLLIALIINRDDLLQMFLPVVFMQPITPLERLAALYAREGLDREVNGGDVTAEASGGTERLGAVPTVVGTQLLVHRYVVFAESLDLGEGPVADATGFIWDQWAVRARGALYCIFSDFYIVDVPTL